MKRVVITGASGFVGANLARRLLADGHQVHALLREGYDHWRVREIADVMTLHIVDLLDGEALAATTAAIRPDWDFHLAAYGANPEQGDLHRMIATNLSATAHLLEAGRRSGCVAFVNAGSSSEYGFKEDAPAEDAHLDPNSYYACTKAAATHLCRFFARERDMNVATLRLYSAYGPYEAPTRLIPTLVRCGLRGEWPPLVNPDTARDFVYVEDICEAFVRAAEHRDGEPGAVYNVGSGMQMTLRDVVEIAREVLPVAGEPAWNTMPGRSWDTQQWRADSHKIKESLGWEPRCSFAEGLRRTVEWCKDFDTS